ncbi:DUF445 family protein [Gordonia sp. TBRC 11910]|uniref:DUF445 family protein n=1 Tax=Gordonia asplenii TaxID=2725283 RepID=A0A848L4T7_9ACTN|nr:DUF445 family protein [Gordonia asplenii]NMO04055.1 DUF445 family protein [Gordonia asplenii]
MQWSDIFTATIQSVPEIITDIEHHWWVYATMPIIAALIGYGTKIVAIKMMFRPQKFKGIGPIGWQGIIPKRAPEMVEVLCDTLTGRLISSQEIIERVDGAELAALIDRPMRAEVARIVRDVAEEYQPAAWNILPSPARDLVVERTQRAAPDAVVSLVDSLTENIDEVFDLQAMVTKEFLADPDTLEKMFLEVGSREFAFIRRSGLFFGFLIGLVQVCVWLIFRSPIMMPLFGLFTGWFTDWAALRLIFNPKEPKKYFGVIKWHGLFLKHKIPVSQEYGVLIATRVLTADRLVRGLFEGPHRKKLVDLFAGIIEESLRDEVGDVDKMVESQVGDLSGLKELGVGPVSVGNLLGAVTGAASVPLKGVTGVGLDVLQIQPMCQAAAEDLVDVMPKLMAGPAEEYLDSALRIKETMVEKMVAMTPEEFEGVLRPAFQADENTLIMVGAILGFLVGDLQVVLMENLVH